MIFRLFLPGWLGGLVLKMKFMLSQLSTKLELKLKMKLSLAKLELKVFYLNDLNILNYVNN